VTRLTRVLRAPGSAEPRYDYSANPQQGSVWYFPAMVGAAALLSLVFATRWTLIAPGLVVGQLALAPFTTPRGDNDGLWVLIFPMLLGFGVVLYFGCGLVARTYLSLRRRRG
jgi:hypothetical protein